MTVVELGNLILSRLLFVSVYLLIPATLCFFLTRGRNKGQAFRLWVWRGFFVVAALVLAVGPLFHVEVLSSVGSSGGAVGSAALPLAVWVCGVLFVAVKLASEERTAKRLLATCEPVLDSQLLSLAAEVGVTVGLKGAVALVSTSACRTPLVVFEKEPVVVLPNWAIATLGREEIAQVLAHEMAHIRGRDGAWSSFQCLIGGILWFHPVVWMAAKQAAISAEMQADAVALRFAASCPAKLANTILLCVTGAQPANVAALSGNGRKLAMRLQALERTGDRPRRWDLLGIGFALFLSAPVLPVGVRKAQANRLPLAPMSIASREEIYTGVAVAEPMAVRRLGTAHGQ